MFLSHVNSQLQRTFSSRSLNIYEQDDMLLQNFRYCSRCQIYVPNIYVPKFHTGKWPALPTPVHAQ